MDKEDDLISQLMAAPILPAPVSTACINVSQPGFQYQYHSYGDEVEIVRVLHGTSFVGINNQFIRIQKNECLIIFPGVTHNYFLKDNESCRMIDLVFKPGDLSTFPPQDLKDHLPFLYELLDPQVEFIRFVDDGSIKGVLERILAHVEHATPQSRMLLKTYYLELYIILSKLMAESLSEAGRAHTVYIQRGLEWMVNFFSTNLTVENIAGEVGISARHFSRLFVKEIGMTVPDYLNLLRIRKAKELLLNTEMDITRIAYAVGYNSSQYFTTRFKRLEHVTPRAFREKMKTVIPTG
jgi:AraC family transcriptional regulator, melibiose operon regulatory protein